MIEKIDSHANDQTAIDRDNRVISTAIQTATHISLNDEARKQKEALTLATIHEEQASFPIVGIGASAGGLAAFEAFFTGMPVDQDPDMAFVIVQHLAPDHKSILTDIIKRYTSMQVFEVADGMTVKVNCVYIIPPNRNMAFLNGALQLFEPTGPEDKICRLISFFAPLLRISTNKPFVSSFREPEVMAP